MSTDLSDEERRERQREASRKSYWKHREKNIERAKKWNAANSEKKREIFTRWKANNPERVRELARQGNRRYREKFTASARESARARMRRLRDADPDRMREQHRAWRASNRASLNASLGLARARRKRAVPKWLSKEQKRQIRAIYDEAKRTGCHVDHIVPLRGRNVSGLHVPWNLQILSPRENKRKYNSFDDSLSPAAQA